MISFSQLKARAYSAVPGYDVMTAQLLDLKELAGAVRVDGLSEGQMIDGLMAAVIAGGPIPQDPEVEILAARNATAAAAARESFYRTLMTRLDSERMSLVYEHADDVFAVIDDEAAEITRQVVELGSIPLTADAAIASDRVDVFRAGNELVDWYTVVRALHAEMWKVVTSSDNYVQLNVWLRPEIVMRFHPPTRHRLTGASGPANDHNGNPIIDGAWPGYQPGVDVGVWPVDDEHRLAWLVWAAGVDGLWMPTPTEVNAAKAAIQTAITEAIQAVNQGRRPKGSEERTIAEGGRIVRARQAHIDNLKDEAIA